MNNLAINQELRKKSKHKLYLCTIFPDKISPETMFNAVHLNRSKRIQLMPIFIRAGYFSHRHKRDEPDPDQIEIRQKYLDAVPDGEWLLILDSDELILAPPDNLADMLDYLDANNMEVGMLAEFRSDAELKGRPRLIKKKKGLRYGGPDMKHDWIDLDGRNYIDVKNDDTAMDLPIYFYHVKTAGRFMFEHAPDKQLRHPAWVEIV